MTRIDLRPVERVGLIVNPRSGKGNGKGLALLEALQGDSRMTIRVIDRFEQLSGFVEDMARDGVTDLFISSGDGTIQEILTQAVERRLFKTLPRICLLPHGTTNLTAADLGLRHRSIAAQAAFLRRPALADLQPRANHSLRQSGRWQGAPWHVRGHRRGCRSHALLPGGLQQQGCQGPMGHFRYAGQRHRQGPVLGPDPHDETRLDRPYDIMVEANGRRYCEGQQLLQMSTTLEKLVLNTRPFWGGKTGPIRTSIFPYPLPSVLRWLLPVMYGGEGRKPPPRAVSFCSEDVAVTSRTMFVIDGEFFPAPENEPLRLAAGPVFTFVCG